MTSIQSRFKKLEDVVFRVRPPRSRSFEALPVEDADDDSSDNYMSSRGPSDASEFLVSDSTDRMEEDPVDESSQSNAQSAEEDSGSLTLLVKQGEVEGGRGRLGLPVMISSSEFVNTEEEEPDFIPELFSDEESDDSNSKSKSEFQVVKSLNESMSDFNSRTSSDDSQRKSIQKRKKKKQKSKKKRKGKLDVSLDPPSLEGPSLIGSSSIVDSGTENELVSFVEHENIPDISIMDSPFLQIKLKDDADSGRPLTSDTEDDPPETDEDYSEVSPLGDGLFWGGDHTGGSFQSTMNNQGFTSTYVVRDKLQRNSIIDSLLHSPVKSVSQSIQTGDTSQLQLGSDFDPSQHGVDLADDTTEETPSDHLEDLAQLLLDQVERADRMEDEVPSVDEIPFEPISSYQNEHGRMSIVQEGSVETDVYTEEEVSAESDEYTEETVTSSDNEMRPGRVLVADARDHNSELPDADIPNSRKIVPKHRKGKKKKVHAHHEVSQLEQEQFETVRGKKLASYPAVCYSHTENAFSSALTIPSGNAEEEKEEAFVDEETIGRYQRKRERSAFFGSWKQCLCLDAFSLVLIVLIVFLGAAVLFLTDSKSTDDQDETSSPSLSPRPTSTPPTSAPQVTSPTISPHSDSPTSNNLPTVHPISTTIIPFGLWEGTSMDEALGARVALSADGSTFATTSKNAVYIYKLTELNGEQGWQARGAPLSSEEKWDSFGENIVFSSNGNRVAIGAPNARDNGVLTGKIYLFDCKKNGSWHLMGIETGTVFDISNDGTTLVTGEPSFNRIHVIRAEEGNDLTRLKTISPTRNLKDACGSSLSLSQNGQKIAIGCESYDGASTK